MDKGRILEMRSKEILRFRSRFPRRDVTDLVKDSDLLMEAINFCEDNNYIRFKGPNSKYISCYSITSKGRKWTYN